MKKIGVLGTGIVGVTLAHGLKDLGYEVAIGGRQDKTIDGWSDKTGTFEEIAAWADMVLVAVKGTAAEAVIKNVKNHISGKTVIDTTNPISDEPPEDGVLRYFTSLNESLLERLQAVAPKANFVKAFNSVGSSLMVKPKFQGGPPTMFICGNNVSAKKDVSTVLTALGWQAKDMGGVKSARAIEPLCMLWCIPGFVDGQWNHAYKLLS